MPTKENADNYFASLGGKVEDFSCKMGITTKAEALVDFNGDIQVWKWNSSNGSKWIKE